MRERSSLGFLNRFGRSGDLRAFDEGLRACGLHPGQVPEGVKLAAVRQVRAFDRGFDDADYRAAGALLAAVARSPEGLMDTLDETAAREMVAQIEAAIDQPNGLDAQLILLALHAKLVHPETVQRYGLYFEGG